MSVFKFRLEKVLKLREIMEEQAQQIWGAETVLLREKQKELDLLHGQKKEIKEFGYGQKDLHLRQAMYNYLVFLKRRIEQQITVVQNQELVVQEARKAYLAARSETKKMTILRDEQYSEFIQAEQREEQKILDDLGSYIQK